MSAYHDYKARDNSFSIVDITLNKAELIKVQGGKNE